MMGRTSFCLLCAGPSEILRSLCRDGVAADDDELTLGIMDIRCLRRDEVGFARSTSAARDTRRLLEIPPNVFLLEEDMAFFYFC